MAVPRKIYYKNKRKCNYNIQPTIICNNCTAGFLLHDLGLKFYTPTINTLFFTFEEFFLFVQNLTEAQKCRLKKITSSKPYPVGAIQLRTGATIRVGFVHYRTFEEAELSWNKRFGRVNYDNLYVLWEGNLSEKDVAKFLEINYPKAVLSEKNETLERSYDFYHGFDFYSRWHPGLIGEYQGLFSVKKHLDDFDYISFLNSYAKK